MARDISQMCGGFATTLVYALNPPVQKAIGKRQAAHASLVWDAGELLLGVDTLIDGKPDWSQARI